GGGGWRGWPARGVVLREARHLQADPRPRVVEGEGAGKTPRPPPRRNCWRDGAFLVEPDPGRAHDGLTVAAASMVRWRIALLASRDLILRRWQRALRQRFWTADTVVVLRNTCRHRPHRGSPVHRFGGRPA